MGLGGARLSIGAGYTLSGAGGKVRGCYGGVLRSGYVTGAHRNCNRVAGANCYLA